MDRERIDDQTLGAYLDGELSSADEARVREALAEDPDLEAARSEHVRLADAVRASDPDLEARLGDDRDSDELFARIEGALDDAAPVRPAREERGATTGSSAAPPPPPVVDLQARRRRFFAGASVALAAAVALFVVLRPTQLPDGDVGTNFAGIPRGSEILDVDFGKSTGTTFSVEGTHGEPLAVVWINDSDVALK